ncbi:TrkH family potassium uptake protein [Hyphobacterium sp. HN65]|uniref:Trk system potassium uptake protein n=1 Tax=Hyphobacterium lacteum TaxID=3116575 RepID=A0ABU7LNI6_9PROT|nr:TrkH family potassium uptake protein [Hyphobacterium sp. HN65]MEE2525467.1 TrkH family potassium uptake protein [Hyphobacterium sp. HN65]
MSESVRSVLFVLAIMVASLAAAMLIPAWMDLSAGEMDSAGAFLWSAACCGFLSLAVALGVRAEEQNLSTRAAFLVTAGSWLVLAIVAALPMHFGGHGLSFTDAVFEAISGLTTTGATVVTELDNRPPGFLMWRAILQWIGGIGIIVTAMAIWPLLGVGGMQLFKLESSDNSSEKVLPRAAEIATAISLIYLALTAICAMAYAFTGMNGFDAIAHAMTTIATGGYSTRDGSLGDFVAGGSDIVAIIFMLLAALPFATYLVMVRGRPSVLWRDPQVQGFFALVVAAVAAMTLFVVLTDLYAPAAGVRAAAFSTVSVITGTGYATADFGAWGAPATAAFFVLMFAGGCAGSTTCSIKIFRYQIALLAIRQHIVSLAHPRAITRLSYGGRPVSPETVYSVLGFLFAFIAVFTLSAALLGAIGLDTTTALSGAATTLANVGPGLGGIIGPAGSFQSLPEAAKWVMMANMLIGRLEVLTVLILFTPRFWQS